MVIISGYLLDLASHYGSEYHSTASKKLGAAANALSNWVIASSYLPK
jgi:hypothetical protein